MEISSALPAPAPMDKSQAKLKQACQGFEAYFLDLMFKEMRKTISKSHLTGDQSNQQQIFTGMMDQTLADAMSKRGDLGIAQMMYSQLAPELGPVVPAKPDVKKLIAR